MSTHDVINYGHSCLSLANHKVLTLGSSYVNIGY